MINIGGATAPQPPSSYATETGHTAKCPFSRNAMGPTGQKNSFVLLLWCGTECCKSLELPSTTIRQFSADDSVTTYSGIKLTHNLRNQIPLHEWQYSVSKLTIGLMYISWYSPAFCSSLLLFFLVSRRIQVLSPWQLKLLSAAKPSPLNLRNFS